MRSHRVGNTAAQKEQAAKARPGEAPTAAEPPEVHDPPMPPASLELLLTTLATEALMAKLLGESGLEEEAWPALLEAIHALACGFAIERRLPAPTAVKDALEPPLSSCWANGLSLLQAYVEDASANWKPATEYLARMSQKA